jgi:hypothetical protein
VAAVKQQPAPGVVVLLTPACGDTRTAVGRLDEIDVRSGAELAHVLLRGPRPIVRLGLQLVERVDQRLTAREADMRRMQRGLARAEMDMQKPQVRREQARSSERRFKD